MRILVVGGAGYVGGAVTDILLKKNWVLELFGINHFSKAHHPLLLFI